MYLFDNVSIVNVRRLLSPSRRLISMRFQHLFCMDTFASIYRRFWLFPHSFSPFVSFTLVVNWSVQQEQPKTHKLHHDYIINELRLDTKQ